MWFCWRRFSHTKKASKVLCVCDISYRSVLLSMRYKERALHMNNEELPLIPSLRSAAASSPGFVQTHHSFRGRRAAHQPGRPLQLRTNAAWFLNPRRQIGIGLWFKWQITMHLFSFKNYGGSLFFFFYAFRCICAMRFSLDVNVGDVLLHNWVMSELDTLTHWLFRLQLNLCWNAA